MSERGARVRAKAEAGTGRRRGGVDFFSVGSSRWFFVWPTVRFHFTRGRTAAEELRARRLPMEAACIWLQPERVSEPARDILPDRPRKRAEGAPIYI